MHVIDGLGFTSRMDKLNEEQRAAITKTANDRLRTKPAKAGYDEDEVFSMERPALMEAMARVVAQGVATGGN